MAETFDPTAHRFGETRYFEDFRVGESFYIPSRTLTMQNRNFIGIGEKVFDILVTQRKPEIKPDGLLDYGARETVDANDGSFSEVVSGPERDAQRLKTRPL